MIECPSCRLPFTQPTSWRKKFCSQSCAAAFNNKARRRSSTTKNRIANTLLAFHQSKRDAYEAKPRSCKFCETPIAYEHRNRQYCKPYCRKAGMALLCRQAAYNAQSGGYNSKKILHNGVAFDSSWEIKLAGALDAAGVSWSRPQKFKLSTGESYTPDFYLDKYHVYLDPKGYVKPSREKNTFDRITCFERDYQTRCFVIRHEQNLTWEHVRELLASTGGIEPPFSSFAGKSP